MNFLQDIKLAVKLAGEVRRAREAGASVEVRTVQRTSERCLDYWPMTTEYGLLHGVHLEAVRAVFRTFDENTQHSLTFSPVTGGWTARAQFWRQQLKPALPPKTYHAVMMAFTGWYAHCLRMAIREAA